MADPFNVRMNIRRNLMGTLLSFFLSGVTPRKDISVSVLNLICAVPGSFNVDIGQCLTLLRLTLT